MAFESAWAIGPNNEEYRLKTEKVLNDDGFTFEIGKGENPLPLSDLEEEYKILQKA